MYSKKLRDPRWQKKRLEVMNRDNFKCVNCSDESTTLNVHHKKYTGEPWEALDIDLETVCEDCHAVFHHEDYIDEKNEIIKLKDYKYGMFYLVVFVFYDYMVQVYVKEHEDSEIMQSNAISIKWLPYINKFYNK